jgi:LysM domain-containing protein
MHNATTKQRLSALRRKLGIFTGGWVKERRARLEELRADLEAALTPPAAFPRPAAAGAGAPGAFLATSLPPPLSGPRPPPEATAPRWVSDSMIVPPTQEVARPAPPPAETADAARATEPFEAPDEARRSRTRWIAAIAAAGVALVAVLLLLLRSPEPASSSRAPSASPPAPAAAVPAPAPESAVQPPLQAAPAPTPARATAAAASPVVVRRGDTLWALSASHLGDPLRWPWLHRANRGKIRDPDLIYPGQRLDLPAR